MAKKKIELYAEAPYKQGYDSAKANETIYNPYSDIEDAEADDLIGYLCTHKFKDNEIVGDEDLKIYNNICNMLNISP